MADEKVIQRQSSEPFLSTYLNRRGCALGLPVSGNFELTSRCNFSCKMCYVHSQSKQESLRQRELNADQWLSLASDARDMGLIFLLLTGGEPLLREDFPYIYRELARMGIMLSVNTNASLFNDEISELFSEYPPVRINATLYGASEETYESLCGNCAYEKVLDNLRRMRREGLPLRLNVSLTPYNAADMACIHALASELGLQEKCTSYMYPPVRLADCTGVNCARFSAEEAGKTLADWYYLRDGSEAFIRRAEKLAALESAGINESSCVDAEQEGVRCRAGRSSFWLTWEGDMLPCGTMNVPPAKPLEVGFAAAWQQVREFTAGIRMPAECSRCTLRENCGVCAAICKGETGSFDCRPDYVCRLTKEMCGRVLELAGKGRG